MISGTQNNLAFTLVELMVVCGLIALLSTLTVLGVNTFKEKSENERRIANVQQLQIALEKYRSVCGVYPRTTTNGSGAHIIDPDTSNVFGATSGCVDGNGANVTFGSFSGDLDLANSEWYYYEATRRAGTGISACEGYQLVGKLLSGGVRYGNGVSSVISSSDWRTCTTGGSISGTSDFTDNFYYFWGPR